MNPRKNSLENFLHDKFNCIEAYKFNEEDPEIGPFCCSCYNFNTYRICIHTEIVRILEEIRIG